MSNLIDQLTQLQELGLPIPASVMINAATLQKKQDLIQAIERSWSGPWGHSLLASVLLGLLHVTACMGKGPEQLNPNSRLNGTQV